MIASDFPDIDLDDLVRRKVEGNSYSEIRSMLADKGYSEPDIHSIIRKVDEIVLRTELGKGERRRVQNWNRTGLVIAAAGLALTIGSNTGWFLVRTPRWIVYTPFFIGILVLLYGRFGLPGPGKSGIRNSEIKGPGRIRRKRPYK